MEMKPGKYEIGIGIGGGHYAPRFTDISFKKNVAFGHIASKYVLSNFDEKAIQKMIDATPGCSKIYFHGKHERIEEMAKKFFKSFL